MRSLWQPAHARPGCLASLRRRIGRELAECLLRPKRHIRRRSPLRFTAEAVECLVERADPALNIADGAAAFGNHLIEALVEPCDHGGEPAQALVILRAAALDG